MAGIYPNNFPLVTPTGTTELYTQTNNVNGKFTLEDLKAYLNEWTEVEINITDVNAIRNCGTTPIEILPAPGVGKYYEYDGMVEYTYNTTQYDFNDMLGILGEVSYSGVYILPANILFTPGDKVIQINSKMPQYLDILRTDTVYQQPCNINERIVLTTWSPSNDATVGDGTFKIKLKYKIHDFG